MLYLSSSAIKKDKISDVIQLCASNGIRNIELSGGTQYYPALAGDLKRQKEEYSLCYACHAYFPPPPKDFVVNLAACNDGIYGRSLQHYLDCLELLKAIECHVLGIHAGFLVEVGVDQIGGEIRADIVYDRQKAMERFCGAYNKIKKEAAKHQIEVYLENNVLDAGNYERFHCHNYFLMTDYASIMEMKKEIDFPLLLDLGHLFVSSHTLGLDFEKQIAGLKEHVRWLHVSDNNGSLDQHKPLMSGSPIYDALLKLADQSVNVTLEAKGSFAQIKENYEWLQRLLPD